MRLGELLERTPGLAAVEVRASLEFEIAGFAHEPERAVPGCLFAVLPNCVADPDAARAEAAARGAVLLLEPGDLDLADAPFVRVLNAPAAHARLAATHFERPSEALTVVGVTGTNGKTTCTYWLRDMLRAAGRRAGMLGTIEYDLGEERLAAWRTLPYAHQLQGLLRRMLDNGLDTAVLEAASPGIGDHRLDAVALDVGVFTQLSPDHQDRRPSIAAYFADKLRLFELLAQAPRPGLAVVGVDCEWGRRLLARIDARLEALSFGFAADADLRAEQVRPHGTGSRFEALTPWGRARVEVPLPGRFNVQNALACLAVACSQGASIEHAAAGLATARSPAGRMEELDSRADFRVFVDYAHNPEGLRAVLDEARGLARGRVIVMFGCGGGRDPARRSGMGEIAGRLADLCVVTEDNSRDESPAVIARDVVAGIGGQAQVEVVLDRPSAIRRSLGLARAGDVVVLAGKGHEREIVGRDGAAREHDERRYAAAVLAELSSSMSIRTRLSTSQTGQRHGSKIETCSGSRARDRVSMK